MQRRILSLHETDTDGTLRRLGGKEQVFNECLKEFLADSTMNQLNESVKKEAWDEAFTAAHALKGVAGNMGFVPLMHVVGQLVILIRGGRTLQIRDYMNQVNSAYRDITDGIEQYFALSDEELGDKK